MEPPRHFETALGALRAGRADRAVELLEPLCRRSPRDSRAWQLLGFAYREEQHMGAALRCFAEACTLDPHDAKSAIAHAEAAFAAGRPAVQLCRRALELAPDDAAAIGASAAVLAAEGLADEAQALLADALARHPDWLDGHRSLAALRWTFGDRESYARSYAAACRALPKNLALRLAWFRFVVQTRDWAAALGIIDDGERSCGGHRAFVIARLFVAAESGARREAQALFERTREWRDEVRDLAWIRHCLRERRPAEAAATALGLTRTASARLAWPYLSIIWRLLEDPRGVWLDGAAPRVRSVELGLPPQDLSALADLLRGLHTARAPHVEQSVRGGTQTDRPLLLRTDPVIESLRARILDAVRDYVADLPPFEADHPLLGTARGELKFAGSWSVRLSKGGYNVPHTHPQGWISSAFYVALPESDRLGPAPAGWLRFGEPPAELGLDLPSCAEIEPRVGRLVLFPSTLWHSTVPFGDGERLGLAFDMRVPSR